MRYSAGHIRQPAGFVRVSGLGRERTRGVDGRLTRRTTTLSTKVNSHDKTDSRALCGTHLVTLPSKFGGNETRGVDGRLARLPLAEPSTFTREYFASIYSKSDVLECSRTVNKTVIWSYKVFSWPHKTASWICPGLRPREGANPRR